MRTPVSWCSTVSRIVSGCRRRDLPPTELGGLCREVSRVTGVKLALEGVYRWIYFMSSKQDPERPVATRYFGVFADGSLKVRGLMCRRRDTPPFVRRAQEAMLAKTGRGGDARGTGGP